MSSIESFFLLSSFFFFFFFFPVNRLLIDAHVRGLLSKRLFMATSFLIIGSSSSFSSFSYEVYSRSIGFGYSAPIC